MSKNINELTAFIWQVADLLRSDFKAHEYGKVILPFVVLRRLDCVLEDSKDKVLEIKKSAFNESNEDVMFNVIEGITGFSFFNISEFNFSKLVEQPQHLKSNFNEYINSYSSNIISIMDGFEIKTQIDKLSKNKLLYHIVKQFADIDLHPKKVSNNDMGYVFEDLIRRFAEASNETAGEHFTPREVVELMVNLAFTTKQDADLLQKTGSNIYLYDPACGTGGMLAVSAEHIKNLNTGLLTLVHGQEINSESYAICASDMLIKDQEIELIKQGDTLKDDKLKNEKFDYMFCNPPFGVEWKKQSNEVKKENQEQGYNGRFGAGLPRISDGSLLFLQHMVSKMKPVNDGGSKIAIVFNGSPMFTGSAGSGESNIRKWLIENDYLEAIISLPNDLFYNTGIATYIWVLTNRKESNRKGKIQLVNASKVFKKLKKSLGKKRNEITESQIDEITKVYGNFEALEHKEDKTKNKENLIEAKILDNEDFGYNQITVQRPLRLRFDITAENITKLQESKYWNDLDISIYKTDAEIAKDITKKEKTKKAILNTLEQNLNITFTDEALFKQAIQTALEKQGITLTKTLANTLEKSFASVDENAEIVFDSKGNKRADSNLKDTENIPLKQDIYKYFKKEVLPHVPDAWIDENQTKIGYEIPFTRYFYKYTPPRNLEDIENDLEQVQSEIFKLLKEL